MSTTRGKEPQLVVGAAPRIDLMPPEVRQRQKDKSARFGLIMMVVIAAGVILWSATESRCWPSGSHRRN